jgi:nucleotide-binding universal stress UspA family protein
MNRWGPRALFEVNDLQNPRPSEAFYERLEKRASESLSQAKRQLQGEAEIVCEVKRGEAWEMLQETANANGGDLIGVGSHGYARFVGIGRSSTATELLHTSACSVLISRLDFDPARFPARLAVGFDGSEGSLAALEVAQELVKRSPHERSGIVVVAGEHPAADAQLEAMAAPLIVRRTRRRAVNALVDEAAAADLLIVGARGLSGAKALGSVSERVAHRAESSVLVVR